MKKILAYFLAFILTFTSSVSVYGEVIVPAHGSATFVDKAANNVPVVNIVDPNSAGVSHNKYNNFNVGTQGVVINNSMRNAVSELGGIVLTNPNLTNEASTIINEVISSSPSSILGPTEILGGKADYIVANPNGIIVNGAEFINTNNVTITTGMPMLDANGDLEKLLVEKGCVKIFGRNLNVKQLDYFDIVSYTAEISSKIHAGKNLQIAVGKVEYDYKKRQVIDNTQDSSGASLSSSAVAIDSKHFGGLYAGKIKIVSTEDGFGVNLPDIKSSVDDIEISADGKITYRNISSEKGIQISSRRGQVEMTEKSTLLAKNKIDIKAAGDVSLKEDTKLKIKGASTITSTNGVFINQGSIINESTQKTFIKADKIINKNTISSEQSEVVLSADTDVMNDGKIRANRQIIIESGNEFSNYGSVRSKDNISISSTNISTNYSSGEIRTNNNLSINSRELRNKAIGVLAAKKKMSLSAEDNIFNEGKIAAEQAEITVARGSLFNEGDIHSTEEELRIFSEHGAIINRGNLFGKSGFNGNFRTLENSGTIMSNDKVFINTSSDFKNLGEISTAEEIDLVIGGTFQNDTEIISSNSSIKINSAEDTWNFGLISSKHEMKVTSRQKIVNGGVIESDAFLLMDSGNSIKNYGHIHSVGGATVKANKDFKNYADATFSSEKFIKIGARRNFSNRNIIKSDRAIEITSEQNLRNLETALIQSNSNIDLISGSGEFSNFGSVESIEGNLKIISDGKIENSGKVIAFLGKIKLESSDSGVINSGIFASNGSLRIRANSNLENGINGLLLTNDEFRIIIGADFINSGTINSARNSAVEAENGEVLNHGIWKVKEQLQLHGEQITNRGEIHSVNNANIASRNNILNIGKLNISSDLKIESAEGAVENRGLLYSRDDMSISSEEDLKNDAGVIYSEGNLLLDSGGKIILTDGGIHSSNIARFQSRDSFVNRGGDIDVGGESFIKSDRRSIYNSGKIIVRGASHYEALEDIENTIGTIAGYQDIDFKTGDEVKNTGKILGDGQIKFTSASDLINSGEIKAIHEIDIGENGVNKLINTGTVKSDSSIEVALLDRFKNSGKLDAKEILVLDVANKISNEGRLQAGEEISVFSQNEAIKNRPNGKIVSQNKTVINAAKYINNAGEIASVFESSQLSIKAGETLQNSGAILTEGKITVGTIGRIQNTVTGNIEAGKRLTINSGDGFINQGQLLSDKNLDIKITHGNFENHKLIVANGRKLEVTVADGFLTNIGEIASGGKLIAKSLGSISNKTGAILKSAMDLRLISETDDIDNKGTFYTDNKAILNSKSSLTNSGKVRANSDIQVNAESIDNSSKIVSISGKIDLKAAKDVISQQKSTFDALGEVIISSDRGSFSQNVDSREYGITSRKSDISVSAPLGIENTKGTLTALGEIDLDTDKDFINSAGNILAHNNLKIIALGKITNKGYLQSEKDIHITGGASLTNDGGLIASSTGKLTIDKIIGPIMNKGVIQAPGTIVIDSKDKFDNHNNIYSDQDINISAGTNIQNTSSIYAKKDLTIKSVLGEISNSGQLVASTGQAVLSGNGQIVNLDGYIWGGREIKLHSSKGSFKSDGANAKLLSLGKTTIKANSIDLNQGEVVSAGLSTDSGGVLKITGTNITSNEKLYLKANEIQGDKVNIHAEGSIDMDSSSEIKIGGEFVSNDKITVKTVGDFTNEGHFQSKSSIINVTNGSILNSGVITVADNLKVTDSLMVHNKSSGSIQVGSLNVSTKGDIVNDNTINVTGTLTIDKANMLTNNSKIKFGTLANSGGILNAYSGGNNSILEGNNLNLRVANFNFSAGTVNVLGLFTGNFTNAQLGRLHVGGSGQNSLTLSGALTNNRELSFDGNIFTITASSITNNSQGKIKGRNLSLVSHSSLHNQGVIYGANSLSINAPTSFSNSNGVFSGGTLDITTNGTASNSRAIISAGNANITAASTTNSGQIISSSALAITGTIDNSGLLMGKSSVTTSSSVTNRGAIKSGYGGGTSGSIAMTNVSNLTNDGEIIANGSLTINGGSITNNSKLEATGALSLTSSGAVTNFHSIYGGTINIKANGGSLTNDNRIISKSNMELTASRDVINKNIIQLIGSGELSIKAGGDIVNEVPGIKVNGMPADRAVILDSKKLKALIKPQNGSWAWFQGVIENYKVSEQPQYYKEDLRAGHNPWWWLGDADTIRDGSTFKFEQKVSTSQNSINPQILSNGSISLSAAGSINNSGSKVASKSSIDIRGGKLLNKDYHNIAFIAKTNTVHRAWRGKSKQGGHKKKVMQIIPIGSRAEEATFTSSVTPVISSLIQAGGSISGNLSGEVRNGSSQSGGGKGFAGGFVPYSTTNINNYGTANALNVSTAINANIPAVQNKNVRQENIAPRAPPAPKLTPQKDSELVLGPVALAMKYQATSKRGNVTMDITNLERLAEAVAVSYESTAPPAIAVPERTNIDAQAPPSHSVRDYNSDLTDILNFDWDDPDINRLVASTNWAAPPPPKQYYIKETSEVFTDFGTYFSTENFIKRVPGYNPKQQPMHLGDSMKQAEFVMRQHEQLTGLASIADNMDYKDQVKTLYERGIKLGNDLDLTPGVALSKELAEQLQEDLVWAEQIEVKGTKIIVPKLYLGKAKRGVRAKGMVASNINIAAGAVDNESDIIANNLAMQVGSGGITNRDGGRMQAASALDLRTIGDLKNIGSTIKSDGSANFEARHIYNITEKTTQFENGKTVERAGPQAVMSAASDMFMNTSGDVHSIGSKMLAKRLGFNIGGDMILQSLDLSWSQEQGTGGNDSKSSGRTYLPTTLQIGEDTEGFIAGDFALIGSTMSSGGDNILKVGGNTTVESQVAGTYSQSKSTSSQNSIWSGTKTKVSQSVDVHETVHSASIEAGGKNKLVNEGEQTFVGAKLKASDGTILRSRKSRLAALMTDEVSSYSSDYKDDWYMKSRSKGYTASVANATEVEGRIAIDADEGATIEYGSRTQKKRGLFGASFASRVDHKSDWMKQLEGQNGISFEAVSEKFDHWNDEQRALTPKAKKVISAVVRNRSDIKGLDRREYRN